jgi:hypothetical protein
MFDEADVSPPRTAVPLVLLWAAIVEMGFRMQQYFSPLHDLDMASINLNWESDVAKHQPTPENQNMCIYGDPTGFSYRRSSDANGIRIVDDTALLAECRNPISGFGTKRTSQSRPLMSALRGKADVTSKHRHFRF